MSFEVNSWPGRACSSRLPCKQGSKHVLCCCRGNRNRKTDFYKPDPDRKQSEHTAVKHHQRHTEQFSTVKVLINSTETNWAKLEESFFYLRLLKKSTESPGSLWYKLIIPFMLRLQDTSSTGVHDHKSVHQFQWVLFKLEKQINLHPTLV